MNDGKKLFYFFWFRKLPFHFAKERFLTEKKVIL